MLAGLVFGLFGFMHVAAGFAWALDRNARRDLLRQLLSLRARNAGGATGAEAGPWAWIFSLVRSSWPVRFAFAPVSLAERHTKSLGSDISHQHRSPAAQDPTSKAVDHVRGSLVALCGLVGMPVIRLRAAVPEQLLRGSLQQAVGRPMGMSPSAIRESTIPWRVALAAMYGTKGAGKAADGPAQKYEWFGDEGGEEGGGGAASAASGSPAAAAALGARNGSFGGGEGSSKMRYDRSVTAAGVAKADGSMRSLSKRGPGSSFAAGSRRGFATGGGGGGSSRRGFPASAPSFQQQQGAPAAEGGSVRRGNLATSATMVENGKGRSSEDADGAAAGNGGMRRGGSSLRGGGGSMRGGSNRGAMARSRTVAGTVSTEPDSPQAGASALAPPPLKVSTSLSRVLETGGPASAAAAQSGGSQQPASLPQSPSSIANLPASSASPRAVAGGTSRRGAAAFGASFGDAGAAGGSVRRLGSKADFARGASAVGRERSLSARGGASFAGGLAAPQQALVRQVSETGGTDWAQRSGARDVASRVQGDQIFAGEAESFALTAAHLHHRGASSGLCSHWRMMACPLVPGAESSLRRRRRPSSFH